ncbi:tetratricopeptide repeat protein [Methanoculleus sp. Afa-1]|jgi:tetratricopeptide (TPR) repeat protein|uniref:Tetratricopeptide repeat protein n=1 Tax=Methanoculleus formosensis TaxID=2590886 RepID=A0A9E4ZKR3_9EURY|nr:hypothetical protein [Methanoculleus sp. Afa-1]MCT8336939.1 tetratricopeptide repeat protein [Methanoculleus sp. Afa-1]
MGLFDRLFKKGRVYEQPYSDEQHEALLDIQKRIPDAWVSEFTPSLDSIKSMERQAPTHWMYKHITDPHQYVYRSMSLRSSMLGEYDKTVSVCLDGLAQYPNDAYLLYMLGRTLCDIGRVTGDVTKVEEALSVLNQVLTTYPDFPDAYMERGSCHLIFKDLDSAENDYLRAIELESDESSKQDWIQTLKQIRAQRNQVYLGRGIKVFYFISPPLKDDKPLKEVGQLEIITKHFHPVYVSGHDKEKDGMWVKLFCPSAKFTLVNQMDQIEQIYSTIFNHVIDDAKAVFNRHGYKVQGYSLEVVYQLSPGESSDIIPMFELKTLQERVVD